MNRARVTGVVLVAGLVAGCESAAEEGPGPSDPARPTASDSVGASGPPRPVALPPGVPTTYLEDMSELAQGYGIQDPPEVSPIRAVSPEEQPQVMADCLTGLGFSAEVADDGRSWGAEFTRSQMTAYQEAEYTCLGRYPLADTYTAPLTDTQLDIYYAWQVEETIPCMEQLGFPTPVPLTEESFKAMYAQGTLWFPDTELDPATLGQDMDTILESCTVTPPDDLLYGQPAER